MSSNQQTHYMQNQGNVFYASPAAGNSPSYQPMQQSYQTVHSPNGQVTYHPTQVFQVQGYQQQPRDHSPQQYQPMSSPRQDHPEPQIAAYPINQPQRVQSTAQVVMIGQSKPVQYNSPQNLYSQNNMANARQQSAPIGQQMQPPHSPGFQAQPSRQPVHVQVPPHASSYQGAPGGMNQPQMVPQMAQPPHSPGGYQTPQPNYVAQSSPQPMMASRPQVDMGAPMDYGAPPQSARGQPVPVSVMPAAPPRAAQAQPSVPPHVSRPAVPHMQPASTVPAPPRNMTPMSVPSSPHVVSKPHDFNSPPSEMQNGNAPKIRELPSSNRNSMLMDPASGEGPPQFVAQPQPTVSIGEGEPCSVSARVRPAGDSSLRAEWHRNGKPLTAASRYNMTFDRGYAVLQFLYANEDDSGEYYCVATSSSGRDQSAPCKVVVFAAEGVVTESQLPEESMLANLAAMENHLEGNGMRNRNEDDQACTQAPHFLRQLSLQPTTNPLRENQPAHFECYIEPSGDPNLQVEWFKDGKPVAIGCRLNSIFDRGFAILDILYCHAEDSGSYCCVAKNKIGQIQSSPVQLSCRADEGIVTKSALSKDSIAYLQGLDSWQGEQYSGLDMERPNPEDNEEPSPPSFAILPQPITVVEGQPARFLVKADGHPRPRVQWFINGDMIASSGQGGNWRIYQDGGISYLEFHRCGNPDVYDVRIVAKNPLGEATADTVLRIEPQPDYRPGLRHVAPENPFKKLAALKKVDCSEELQQKMQKPKAQAVQLRKIERSSEHKGRAEAENNVMETENLYTRVQRNLRSSRSSVPRQQSPSAGEAQQQQANFTISDQKQSKPQPSQNQVGMQQQGMPRPPQHQQPQQPMSNLPANQQMMQGNQNAVAPVQQQQPIKNLPGNQQITPGGQNVVAPVLQQQPQQMVQRPQSLGQQAPVLNNQVTVQNQIQSQQQTQQMVTQQVPIGVQPQQGQVAQNTPQQQPLQIQPSGVQQTVQPQQIANQGAVGQQVQVVSQQPQQMGVVQNVQAGQNQNHVVQQTSAGQVQMNSNLPQGQMAVNVQMQQSQKEMNQITHQLQNTQLTGTNQSQSVVASTNQETSNVSMVQMNVGNSQPVSIPIQQVNIPVQAPQTQNDGGASVKVVQGGSDSAQVVGDAGLQNQEISGSQMVVIDETPVESSEYQHDETTADFTIEL